MLADKNRLITIIKKNEMSFENRQKKCALISSKLLTIAVILFLASESLNSQVTDPIPDTDIRPVTFSGSLGIISEGYAVSGIDARRPPGMGRITLNTNFTLFGLSSGFNMIYSTDDNALRQSMNRFYFHGTWRWLTLSVGDVSPRFTKYSLGGVTVRGGMVDINPGAISLSATAGRTRRAVEFSDKPGFREPSFEQWLYAARLGFGKQGGTQFALTGVYVHDAEASIENWGALTPAENLSITPEFNLSFFDGAFFLTSNMTVSLFTRDITTEELDVRDIPGAEYITGLFTPRSGSRVDYAGEVTANINAGPVRITGGYERIQPGFMSLGLGHIRSDQELIRVRPQVRLMNGRVSLGGNFTSGRNNLLETRISTTGRQQIGANANMRLSQSLNLTLSFMQMENENRPVDMTIEGANEMHQKQLSRNFMVVPTLVIRSGNMAHSVSLNGSYQVLDDQSSAVLDGARQPVEFTNISTGLTYGTSLPSGLSVNLSGNLLRNEMGESTNTGYSFNTSAGYGFFERRLTTSLTLGFSQNGIEYVQRVDENDPLAMANYIKWITQQRLKGNDIIDGEYIVSQWSRQLMMNLSASYRLPNGNPLRFMIRGLINTPSDEDAGQAYDEVHATLRYEHRF